jgi:hypothetical protein
MATRWCVRALSALAFTQVQFATLLGHSARAMRAWIAGTRMIPQGVAILVRLLVAGRITAADVEAARDSAGRQSVMTGHCRMAQCGPFSAIPRLVAFGAEVGWLCR